MTCQSGDQDEQCSMETAYIRTTLMEAFIRTAWQAAVEHDL